MTDTQPLLQLADIRFAWPGDDAPVLQIDALALPRPSQLFIYGPSGCGKSTLLSLLTGMQRPQSGQIRFMGHPLHRMNAAQRDQLRADHIGYVFQQFNLLPYLSVLENIGLVCRFSALRRQKAIARSGSVEQEARRLLGQLKFPPRRLHQPVMNLSIGQQQRVGVARALIGSPELIIADEPTSALDQDNRDRFVELMLAEVAHSDSSVLMVSHDRQLASHFASSLALPSINRGVSHHDDD